MINIAEIQAKISDWLIPLLDSVMEDRVEHCESNTSIGPSRDAVMSYVKDVANKNAKISRQASMIPGPVALLGIVTELKSIIENQMNMVFDIAYALNKHKKMNKEILAGIMTGSHGTGTNSLFQIDEKSVFVKDVPENVIQKLLIAFGMKIGQELATSMVAKFIPIAGSMALAAWSKTTTINLGKKAFEILSKEIIIEQSKEPQLSSGDVDNVIDENNDSLNMNIEIEKRNVLINLTNADWVVDKAEFRYLAEIITGSSLPHDEKSRFLSEIQDGKNYEVDYSIIRESEIESNGLIIDMVALSKIDGDIHPSEVIYINSVADKVGFDVDSVYELLKS